MTQTKLYPVLSIKNGMLYAMAKPSADALAKDIGLLKDSGINQLVCLLETAESQQLGLDREADQCAAQGLGFSRFAIKDYGTAAPAQLYPFIEDLYTVVSNGSSVVVHCRGGIGRTGLVCCCLLIRAGFTADKAIALVSKKRQQPVPETPEQIATIKNYAKHNTTQ